MIYHIEITPKPHDPPHKREESEYDLSFEELERRFLAPYRMARPIVIDGRTIKADNIHRIGVYRSGREIGHLAGIPMNMLTDITDVTNEFIGGPPGYGVDESSTAVQQARSTTSMRVFISHSSSDVDVAELLIELLRNALHLRSDEIRCTSVDGYRMHAGAPIDEELRAEVHDAELLVGLITPDSMRSAYVIFELGARWGAEKPMIPLLASGATSEHLEGPLAGINAIDARESGQVYQFVENAARYLDVTLDKTSSYMDTVNELVQRSTELATTMEQQSSATEPLQLSKEARELLVEATRDEGNKGMILMTETMAGLSIKTNGKSFVQLGDSRSEAKWKQALDELYGHGLVEDGNGTGRVFRVTHRGYECADSLASQ